MNKIISLIVVFSLAVLNSHAQFENHRWYFIGDNDFGIQFDTASNVPLITHEHNSSFTAEGSGVANNPTTGELFFYTTGDKVYDLSHQVMPNGGGLTSNSSCAQKGIICPKPGNCNQFYVFQNTSAKEAAPGSVYYSVVDMSLVGNGAILSPLGDVVVGQKNIFLKNNSAEAMCVVRSTSTNLFWLIISTYDANELYVYKIDSLGITSWSNYNVPVPQTDFRNFSYNYQANKLAMASGVESEASLIIDFNRTTGILSNTITIPGTPVGSATTYYEGMFDCAWSPDGTKLYITKARTPGGITGGKVYQYDLNSPSTNAQPVFINGGAYNDLIWGIQLAPNGKIYFVNDQAINGYRYLGVIHNPNAPGSLCLADSMGYDLGTNVSPYFKFSEGMFPNHPPIAINDTITVTCSNSTTTNVNILSNDTDIDDNAFQLAFDVLPPGVNITINANLTINLELNNVSGPTVMVPYSICDNSCFSRCDYGILVINIPTVTPIELLGNDTTICNGNTINLNSLVTADSYLWSNTNTGSSISINSGGLYWLEVDISGCYYADSIMVAEEETPNIDLGNDETICNEGFIILDATTIGASYNWNTGSTSSQILANTNGSYWVEVTNSCGSDVDSININFQTEPIFSLGPDTSICPGDSISLSAFYPGSTTQWNNGSTAPVIYVNVPGQYWASITNDCGISTDTIDVGVKKCLGVEDLASYIMVYPNPADELVSINLTQLPLQIETISLYDVSGKQCLIYTTALNEYNVLLNVASLPSGLYILELSTDNKQYRKKLVIQ